MLDGKLYVEAFLKEQEQRADDEPQDLAQSILASIKATNEGFEAANAARNEDIQLLKGMLSNLTHKVGQLELRMSQAESQEVKEVEARAMPAE